MSSDANSDDDARDPDAEAVDAGSVDVGPVDQLGIPMSREPTIDDVRSDGEQHRRFALGCSVIVALLVVAFWLIRGTLLAP